MHRIPDPQHYHTLHTKTFIHVIFLPGDLSAGSAYILGYSRRKIVAIDLPSLNTGSLVPRSDSLTYAKQEISVVEP
jgi:hypothetical protein